MSDTGFIIVVEYKIAVRKQTFMLWVGTFCRLAVWVPDSSWWDNPPFFSPQSSRELEIKGCKLLYRKQHHNAMKFNLLSSNYKRLTYNYATSNMYF